LRRYLERSLKCPRASLRDPLGGFYTQSPLEEGGYASAPAGGFQAGAGVGAAEPAERGHHREHLAQHRLAAAFGARFFGWSVRRKLGFKLESEKTDGERVYRIAAGKSSGCEPGNSAASSS
jgi:hypothetical protein